MTTGRINQVTTSAARRARRTAQRRQRVSRKKHARAPRRSRGFPVSTSDDPSEARGGGEIQTDPPGPRVGKEKGRRRQSRRSPKTSTKSLTRSHKGTNSQLRGADATPGQQKDSRRPKSPTRHDRSQTSTDPTRTGQRQSAFPKAPKT
jgi:hypothetical protein